MANRLPAYVFKDFAIAVGNVGNRIGQASEVTLPVLAKTTEAFRNAGMVKPREVLMGYEVTTMAFKETSFDPDMLALFGIGNASSLIVYGYLESEDGTTHAARFEIVADVKGIDAGSWSSGGRAEVNYDVSVHSGVLFIDDEEILAFDDFDVSIRGRSEKPGRRAALRLD